MVTPPHEVSQGSPIGWSPPRHHQAGLRCGARVGSSHQAPCGRQLLATEEERRQSCVETLYELKGSTFCRVLGRSLLKET